jgi:hypothetical protein
MTTSLKERRALLRQVAFEQVTLLRTQSVGAYATLDLLYVVTGEQDEHLINAKAAMSSVVEELENALRAIQGG